MHDVVVVIDVDHEEKENVHFSSNSPRDVLIGHSLVEYQSVRHVLFLV